MKETFEQFLEGICFEKNPHILDDDMSDFFDGWVTEIQVDELISYGQDYGDAIRKMALDGLEDINKTLKI